MPSLQLDDRHFNRIAIITVVAGFSLLLLAFVTGLLALIYAQRSNERVNHTYEVVDRLAQIGVLVERIEASTRGNLVVPDPVRAATFRENNARIAPALDQLSRLLFDNPAQLARMAKLRRQISEEQQGLESINALTNAGDLAAARAVFAIQDPKRRVNAIRATAAELRAEERRLLAERTATERGASGASRTVLLISALLLVLVGLGAIWLVRRYTADLTRARNRLHLLNTDLEGAVRTRTADLQQANAEIQRFAYIVSHDLRSPLVNIMGFTAELENAHQHLAALVDRVEAEAPHLIDEPGRLAAREDLPEAVGFIRASTQKMDRLINSILRLSREGRRTLTPERLPMESMLADIAASFEQQLGESNSRLLVHAPLPNVVSDRVAVEQILSNLIENAIKYGAKDRPGVIEVEGEQADGRIAYVVRDNGRGIDQRDHQRIFDLFRRSGTQDKPGEGLGLAHVRALAHRLGGTINVESELGKGSTFRLTLPATYRDQEAIA
jgi:signal transduction histidine kinase